MAHHEQFLQLYRLSWKPNVARNKVIYENNLPSSHGVHVERRKILRLYGVNFRRKLSVIER